MKRIKKYFLIVLSLLIIYPSILTAQNLDETLSNLSSDAAKSYVSPVVTGFGSNLNAGWFAYAPEPVRMGLTARLRIVGNATFFGDADKIFNTSGMFRYTSAQADEILSQSGITPQSTSNYQQIKNAFLAEEWKVNFNGPTIIGEENEHLAVEFEGTTLNVDGRDVRIDPYKININEVKGYLNGAKFLPSPNIQLTVGTLMGTNVAFRWFPALDIQDLGKFTFFGFGVMHNTNIWFKPNLPVDISLGVYYQNLKVGDIFESSATKYGVYFSKTFGGPVSISPYAGLSMESSKTSVSYDYQFDTPDGTETTNISFDAEGDNNFGFTLGFSAKLVIVNFNIDYKIAKSNTLTAGLAFGIL